MIERYTQGKTKGNKLEASAVAIGRGLENNPRAVDLILIFYQKCTVVSGNE